MQNPRKNVVIEIIETYDDYYRKVFIDERTKAYEEIDDLVNSYQIVLFIRGTP